MNRNNEEPMETFLVFRNLTMFPSLNILLREHWAERKKRVDALQWLIREQTINMHSGPVRITFTRYAHQLQDWDNHCASFKLIGDALVKQGIIVDDKPTIVKEFLPKQEIVKKAHEKKITVLIQSIL